MECVQFIFTLDEMRYFFVLEKAVFLSRMSPRVGLRPIFDSMGCFPRKTEHQS
jgi:hypothetical protein